MSLSEENQTALWKAISEHGHSDPARDCIEGIGWVWAYWCDCGWHGPNIAYETHLVDALTPTIAAMLATVSEASA